MMRAVIKHQDSVVPRIARIKDHRRWGAGRTVLLACDSCDSDIRYLVREIWLYGVQVFYHFRLKK